MGKYVYVRDKKAKAGEPGWWPDKKKLEVLTTFLATGNQTHTAAITGVPTETIRYWRRSEWWAEQEKELKADNAVQLDNKLTKVMDKALDAVLDRIENGEYVFNQKTGKIQRVQAKLRDVQKVANDMIDKKQLLEKVHKAKEETKQTITADHLVLLAKEFAKFASGGKEKSELHDVTSVYEGEHQEVFETLGVETKDKRIEGHVDESGNIDERSGDKNDGRV